MKVKDIIDKISADEIEVVKVSHFIGKTSHTEILYTLTDKYDENGEDIFNEEIHDKDYLEKEVMTILAPMQGWVQIRIF